MKTALTLAALLALSSAAAIAQEAIDQAPAQMTAEEMDQVVGGAGPNTDAGAGDRIRDYVNQPHDGSCEVPVE